MASVVFMSCFEVSSAVRALASSKRSYRNQSVSCNQMVTSLKAREIMDLEKKRVKLVPNFTSIPFDYLSISWVI